MRKSTALILLLLAVMVPAFAQHKGKDHDSMRKEILEFKMKFIAQEIELKDEQQKQFFDVYTQMSEEKEKIHRDSRALERKLKDSENASDEEYKKVSSALNEAKEKELEIDRKYEEKFGEFLSQKQIFKMKEAERKFRDKMQQIRSNKHGEKKKK